jgi:leucyl-tRNA synthetase
MSKSKYNVINPEVVTDRYGTDCFRMYEMFLGPIEQSKPWDTNGIDGVHKFLRKFIDLFFHNEKLHIVDQDSSKEELKILHTAIKKVNEDIDNFSFNTCISAMMICVNDLRKINCHNRIILESLVKLMAPFAPFLTEELWSLLGHSPSIHQTEYPSYNEVYLKEDTVQYPICINGKKRGIEEFEATADKSALEKAVMELEYVQKWLEGEQVKKIIVVPGRMINIVI